MPTVTEGGVTVDSNVGTEADLRAELATETAAEPRRGKLTKINEVPPAAKVTTPQADGHDGAEEVEEADEQAQQTTDADASAAGKALNKKKKSYQARLDELSERHYTTAKERDDAKAEAARLQDELDVLKGTKRPAKDGKPAVKIVGGVALDAERFPKYGDWVGTAPDGASDLEDWVEARDDWRSARQAEKDNADRAARAASLTVTEEFRKAKVTFDERLAPTLAADPKFLDKIEPELLKHKAVSALPPGTRPTFMNFIVEQVLQSDTPKEVMLWLSKPDTLRRLATLKPDQIVRQFAKIESQNRTADDSHTGPSAGDDDETDEPPKPRSQKRGSADDDDIDSATSLASPPVKPVRGSSQHAADQEPGDDASDDDWYRYEQRKASRKARK